MNNRQFSLLLVASCVFVFGVLAIVLVNESPVIAEPANYTYTIVNVYPHDKTAFTQGLVYEDRVLYEGTGKIFGRI